MSSAAARERKRNEQRLRMIKTLALFIFILIILTVGETDAGSGLPSWSGVLTGLSSGADALSASDIEVHVIDVGQGDCTLVRSGEYNILIDCGDNGRGDDAADYLEQLGITRLDLFVMTHPHSDHMGGLDELLTRIETACILMPELPEDYLPDNYFFYNAMDVIYEQGIEVRCAAAGEHLAFGGLLLRVLHPAAGEWREDINDMSICLHISCGDFSLITCGDITYEVEEELLAGEHFLKSTVYIANHHGSALSNTEEFILAADPDCAVFSCGENNGYGHPHPSVLDIMDTHAIPYYRTDRNGTVVISCIGGVMEITTEK